MPSKEAVEKALRSITRRANYDYFFSKLDNPDWIVPLRENGLFSNPPSVETDGTHIRHFHWPESKYLMRVAAKAPDIVTETILLIPETDNERVHEDFVEASLAMPIELAKKIAKAELKWIRSHQQFYFLYPGCAGKLISYLSENGELSIALYMFEALLAVDSIEREYGAPGGEGYHKSKEIVAKFSTWEYERVVDAVVPVLTSVNGIRTISSLCGLLESVIDQDLNNPSPPVDLSYMWLTAIEENEQNRHAKSYIKGILAIAVRECALQILAEQPNKLPWLVEFLESKNWAIFKRMALYLLSLHADENVDMVSQRLTDKALFDGAIYRHEYALLADAGFGLIGDPGRQEILSWVEAIPTEEDIEDYNRWHEERTGTALSGLERVEFIERQRLNKLWQFRNHLPTDWADRYEEWVQKYNEPEHPDFSFYLSGATWVGPTTPKTSEELQEMTISEIVEYIKGWVPPKGEFEATPEGLGRSLAQAVSNDSVRFASEATLFIGLEPTYVRGFIDGLREATKRDDFPWSPLLELFEWVVKQDRESPEPESIRMREDPGWSWCRKSVAGVLTRGLNSGAGEIPFEFRDSVWEVLAILVEDPDPTDEEYGDSHQDPATRSINSVRGEAMHAAVGYGLWVFRNSGDADKSFDLMPELRVVLENHLDDPSLAIRSVYGQKFPWLHLMDSVWAETNKEKVFPTDQRAYWDSSWKTYITFCQPYDLMIDVLREQYAHAIANLGTPSEVGIRLADAEQRLAEHLMVFYLRGKLTLEDALIRSLYEKSSVDLKAHAMEFLGRSLRDVPQSLDVDIEGRLKAFWEWRLSQARESDAQELAGYCWWVASGKMDADWSLQQLKTVLALPIKFDALDFAAEALVKLMEDKPAEVLECLDLMIGCLNTDGVYFSWNDEAKQILSSAMQSKNESLGEKARSTIHRLGAMGHFEFRELLP